MKFLLIAILLFPYNAFSQEDSNNIDVVEIYKTESFTYDLSHPDAPISCELMDKHNMEKYRKAIFMASVSWRCEQKILEEIE